MAAAVVEQRGAHVEGAARERVWALAHQRLARCRLADPSLALLLPHRVRPHASIGLAAHEAGVVVALGVPDSGRAAVVPDAVGPDLDLLRAEAVHPGEAHVAGAELWQTRDQCCR